MKTSKSAQLFKEALRLIPGGVNSPVRAFASVGRTPVFIRKARGSRLWDVDGNEYIDYVGSWGPMILGHAHPQILRAVKKAADGGTSFGAATEREVEMAELISTVMPSVEMVRMVNSGTEATMSAIRLARAFTGKDKIIKFEGCYHGHADSFLIKAGSGAMTLGVPDSPGVPAAIGSATLTARYNDLVSLENLLAAYPGEVAGLIVEPVVGNMGCVPPAEGFLQGLRSLCTNHGIVFIMDEVMTGFRVALGGAQQLYGIKPDLTTLGKIIGGGLPVGAYRRQKGNNETSRPVRTDVPGGDAFRKPACDGRRNPDDQDAFRQKNCLRSARKKVGETRTRASIYHQQALPPSFTKPGRLNVHVVFHERKSGRLRNREEIRHKEIRLVFLLDA